LFTGNPWIPIKDDFSKNPFIPGDFNTLFKEGKYNKVIKIIIIMFLTGMIGFCTYLCTVG
jgi:hypothetical protein